MSNGPTLGQATHTLTLIGKLNPSAEHLKRLHDGHLTDLVQAIMDGTLPPREDVRKFYGLPPLESGQSKAVVTQSQAPTLTAEELTGTLTVDYSQTLEEMIVPGCYDWKNGNITPKRFPIVGTGIVEFEFKLFDFGNDISSEAANAGIKADDKDNPWESAKTEHLLAYGAKFPEAQRKNPIVALGSVAKVYGYRRVPYLDKVGSGRYLFLGWFDYAWYGDDRFLAVRKKVSQASVS